MTLPDMDRLAMYGGTMKGWRLRNDCRLCGSAALERVLSLPNTPLANEFPKEPGQPQDQFPLFLAACQVCSHVQLPVVVDPERLFGEYVYVSGTSPVFVDHFRRYAEACSSVLSPGDLVVEIGSNDGTLLRFFRERGMRVIGVDPALEIANKATDEGIPTWATFFTEDVAHTVEARHGKAQLVVANNVFAHADDLAGIARGVRDLLTPDGRFVFEVSYLPDVLQHTLFDTIYHEHLSYHSVGALCRFFRELDMLVVDAQRVNTHGGSIRVTVAKGLNWAPAASVLDRIGEERALWIGPGDDPRPTFEMLRSAIEDRRTELAAALDGVSGPIYGYGAPAKATTLLRTFGMDTRLDAIVDDSPLKQGRWLPGGRIPVLPSSAIADIPPDAIVVLAWNFADSILEKLSDFRKNGGRCIVPLPEVRVV
jgi:SAM-dependent methyltransferase